MRSRINEVPRSRWLVFLQAIQRLVGKLVGGLNQSRLATYRHTHRIADINICWLMEAKVGKDSV